MRFINKIFGGILVLLAFMVAYWVVEPDPLQITKSEDSADIIVCVDGAFSFKRHVVTSKYLQVSVEPRLFDFATNSTFVLEGKTYEGAAQDGIVTYRHRIGNSFPSGVYEYKPTLNYAVNPIKSISKAAPSQIVVFGCRIDSATYKEVVDIVSNQYAPTDLKIELILLVMEGI
jgi:hypothetical protein